jgi:hypothetical protein
MTESWGEGSWGETPWGGGVITVTLDSITYCACAYVSPIFLTPSYCTDIFLDAEARLTAAGRSSLARTATEGLAFRVKEFSLGRGGFQVDRPCRVTEVQDPALSLIDEIYRAPIDDVDEADVMDATFVMRVTSDQVWSVLGEIGLWAQIEHSIQDPDEVGSWFLFAQAHFPIISLTGNQARTFRVTIVL